MPRHHAVLPPQTQALQVQVLRMDPRPLARWAEHLLCSALDAAAPAGSCWRRAGLARAAQSG
jgi:hypothetical protein